MVRGNMRVMRFTGITVLGGVLLISLFGCVRAPEQPQHTETPSARPAVEAVFATDTDALDAAARFVQKAIDLQGAVRPHDTESMNDHYAVLGEDYRAGEETRESDINSGNYWSGQINITVSGFIDRSRSNPEIVEIAVCLDRGAALQHSPAHPEGIAFEGPRMLPMIVKSELSGASIEEARLLEMFNGEATGICD